MVQLTFSGYLKSKTFSKFLKSIQTCNISNACLLMSELDLSGYGLQIWNKLIQYYCKEINIANPCLLIYLNKK